MVLERNVAEMTDDNKSYKKLESVLQQISKQIIALPKEEVKINNEILREILDKIIQKMKGTDALFTNVYRELFFGGSYYDGLKIAHPDEYDIHMLLTMPPVAKTQVIVSNVPGFVHVKFLENYTDYLNGKFENFKKFISKDHFIEASEVRQWMEKTFQKALNTFPQDDSKKYLIETKRGICMVNVRKTGPAFTLRVEKESTATDNKIFMDVDLVPCFIFAKDKWPQTPFRPNPCQSKPDFYIVPKQPKTVQGYGSHYWLLNFQEQEREIIKGLDRLKPTVKLLKKMRDTLQHDVIVSYYLKSVALWVMEEKNDPSFWKSSSLGCVFMTVLKKYHYYLREKNIPYYWNKNYNFVENLQASTLENIYNKITKVIADVEKNLETEPYVILKYLVAKGDKVTIILPNSSR